MLLRAPDEVAGGAEVRRRRSWRRRLWRLLAALAIVLLLPVPWQHHRDSRVGFAWGMDNRLVVEGERLDPPGQWSWLTAGRPALVGELAWRRAATLLGDDTRPVARDLRVGPRQHRPVAVEPLAAAVGLAAARGHLGGDVEPVDAVIGGHGPPYDWVRSLSVGSSHALMVGLVTYAAVTGEDLAGGRHVAGTGQLAADGTVGGISRLQAKAGGARRAGVDVLLVPAAQVEQLDGVDLGSMQVLGVRSLHDAIAQLRATR